MNFCAVGAAVDGVDQTVDNVLQQAAGGRGGPRHGFRLVGVVAQIERWKRGVGG